MAFHLNNGQRRRSSAAPLGLLLLALATTFLFDRGHVIRTSAGAHGIFHSTVARNLTPEHGFHLFRYQTVDPDGDHTYVPYNRFPVFGYVLTKVAMSPFADDMIAQLFAVRFLSLAFFAAAAVVAWLALRRLAADGWAALAATLLSFSSYPALYFADVGPLEGPLDLFGVMLAFHGMAVFATEGRFRQLVVKTCVALMAGWHVYALLLPYAVFELAGALRRRDRRAARRQLTLGVVAFLFGSAVLAANFAREYAVLGGEGSLAELPSVESALRRTGLASRGEIDWPLRAVRQTEDVAGATVPHAVGYFISDVLFASPEARRYTRFAMAGLGSFGVLYALVLVVSPATRHRVPLAAIVLSGPCWLVGLSHTGGGHEDLFFVGIPLVLFFLMLLRVGRDAVLASVAVAAATFGLSSFLMAGTLQDRDDAAVAKAMAADMESIRESVGGKTIYAPRRSPIYDERASTWHSNLVDLYFGGSNVIVKSHGTKHFADVVVGERLAGVRTLTPRNELLFLYDLADYDAYWMPYERHAEQGAPILTIGGYDVHLVRRDTRDELLYVRDDCPSVRVMRYEESDARIFLHAYPLDVDDLPAEDRRYGFDDLDFGFWNHHWRKDDKCYGVRLLPDYGIAGIHTEPLTMPHRHLLRRLEADGPEAEQGWTLIPRSSGRFPVNGAASNRRSGP